MKILKIVVILIIVSTIFFALKQSVVLEIVTDIKKLQLWIASFHHWGYVVFALSYIFAALFLLPGSAFTIAAGIVFGPIKGAIIALFSSTLAVVVTFILARFWLRSRLIKKFGEHPIFKKIDDGVTKNGTSFLILTRLVPIFPFSLQNYAYGLTSLKLTTYTLVSMVTMLPGVFIFAYMAGDYAANGVSLLLLIKFASAGLLLFVVSLIPKYLAKKKDINLKEITH